MLTSFFSSRRMSDCSLYICFMIHFLVALDALVIVPFSSIMALAASVPASQSGYLTSVYAIAAALTCLMIKGSQDMTRERKRILFYLAGIAITTLITSMLDDFALLLLARIFTGVFGGALAVVNLNYLILMSDEKKKKKNTAILISAFPLALALGVPGLIMVSSGTHWQFGFQLLGMAFILSAFLFLFVHLTSPKSLPTPGYTRVTKQNTPISSLRNHKILLFSAVLIFTAILSTFVVSTQYPVMLTINLDIPEKLLSLCYTISGLGSFVLIQYYARARMSDITVSKLIGRLSLVMAIAVALGFHTENVNLAALAFVIFIIVSSARTLILITELISALTPQDRVIIIGLQNSLQHFAVGLGGALGSLFVTSQADLSVDFSAMTYVAIALIACTPVLWKGKSLISFDKVNQTG
ncbi:MFS transporter [Photobacterium sp. WH77]|uniref:MFS transporter n=1 Tax=unclassified Photobacterium TaxID=2628852 RepID=UPI001C44B4CA|nr:MULTISPECIES: MFS transporter [unclassified Photobacterium]MBV7263428.1 MFS transporter [Photobacterium sp. WH24]MCG2838090.1 MFS transporter [Photobacterium sp. WH77]MCG2845708.1 MFS transporter [Photobacterium sp. WH80]